MGEITSPDKPGVRYFKTRDTNGQIAHLYAHGVDPRCLRDVAMWFNRPDVTSALKRVDTRYESAEHDRSAGTVTLYGAPGVTLYPGHSRRSRKHAPIRAVSESITGVLATGDPIDEVPRCSRKWGVNRNNFYCKTQSVISRTLYSSAHRNATTALRNQYGLGGCTAGIPTIALGERFILTAQHCHDERLNRTNDFWSSWHGILFPTARDLAGRSRNALDSGTVDVTAVSTGGHNRARAGYYMTPSPRHRRVARIGAVRTTGVFTLRPAMAGKLELISSRPSAEVRPTTYPNGVARGFYFGESTVHTEGRTRAVSVVGGMSTCQGDSGSGVFVERKYPDQDLFYLPVGVTSAIRTVRPGEPLYKTNLDLYPLMAGFEVPCDHSALVAQAGGYVTSRGVALMP